jgi:hypothetical protein
MEARSVSLTQINIPDPCPVAWRRLQRDGANPRRFCDTCNKHVHDLSAMTEREAAALIESARGELCVRVRCNRRGQPVFASNNRIRRFIERVACSGVLSSLLLLVGCGSGDDRRNVAGNLVAIPIRPALPPDADEDAQPPLDCAIPPSPPPEPDNAQPSRNE